MDISPKRTKINDQLKNLNGVNLQKMEWFEKEYKKRFENESSLDGVNNNLLWDQISKAVPQEKSAKKSPYWKWTLLVMTSLVVLLSLILKTNKNIENYNHLHLFQSDMSTPSGVNDVENNISKNELLNVNDIKTNEENKTLNSEPIHGNITAIKTNPLKMDTKVSETTSSNNKTSIVNGMNGKLNLSSNQKSTYNSEKNHPRTDIISEQLNSEFPNNEKNSNIDTYNIGENNNQTESLTLQAEDEFKKAKKASLSNDTNLKEIEFRNLLEIYPLGFLKSGIISKNKKINIPAVARPKIIVNKKNPWAVNIHSSANFFSLKYKDDANPELFASEANASLGSLQIGNSFGINLEYQLNNSWSVSSGIEYNNYENKLSTILVSDTTILDDFQKIRKAQNIRSVDHHNKLSTLSIPVAVIYDYKMSNKWSIGASIGVSYSIVRSQKGRFLGRNQTIFDYSENENSQFDNFMSYKVNPYIRYRFNNQVSIDFTAGLSYQNNGQISVQELTQSSMIYNIGIGLKYKL